MIKKISIFWKKRKKKKLYNGLSIIKGDKCGNYQQCNFTPKTETFHHPHTGKAFTIKGKTNNVIYTL